MQRELSIPPSPSSLPTSEACSLLEWEPPAEGDALRLGDTAGLSALSEMPFSPVLLSATCKDRAAVQSEDGDVADTHVMLSLKTCKN